MIVLETLHIMLRTDSGPTIPLGKVLVDDEVLWWFSPHDVMEALFCFMRGPFFMQNSDQSVFPFWIDGLSATVVFEASHGKEVIITTEASRLLTTVKIGDAGTTRLEFEDSPSF